MSKLWLYIPIIFIAIYLQQTWISTYTLMSTSNNQNDGQAAQKNTSVPNFIYSPLESGSYIEDIQVNLVSPFASRDADKTIVIVGGGLAGLSTAIEAVDLFYSRFEDVLKFFTSNLKAKDYSDILVELETLTLDELDMMIKSSPEVNEFLDNVAQFKVLILEKESKIGGNSMKASSGINAVNTQNQKNWFVYKGKTNPGDDEKHPDLYFDNNSSFLFDTMKSSVSPEPPIWEPISTASTSSTAPRTDNDLLKPLSPFTPDLIKHVVDNSNSAIPFLEKEQIFDFSAKLAYLLFSKYYPSKKPLETPSSQSKRHLFNPPKNIELFLTKFSQLGGHRHPRTHRPGPQSLWGTMKGPELPIGAASISSLNNRLGLFPYNLHIATITNAELVGLTYPSQKTLEEQGIVPIENVNFGKTSNIVNGIIYKIDPGFDSNHNSALHALSDVGKLFGLRAANVVLATGGFSASPTLLKTYAPSIASMNLPTTNGPWATGDAISIGLDAGAAVVGMEMIQIHPTSFVVPSEPQNKVNFLAPEALRGVGGILLNLDGKRFVNELTTRDVASRAIYWQPQNISYLVLSDECAVEFGGAINFYASKGIFAKTAQYAPFGAQNGPQNDDILQKRIEVILDDEADRVEMVRFVNSIVEKDQGGLKGDEMTIFGVETTSKTYLIIDTTLTMLQLTKTLKSTSKFSMKGDFFPLVANVYAEMIRYSRYSDQKDDEFGRPFISRASTFGFATKQYYIALVTPAIHFTMGGLAIDTKARVIEAVAFDKMKAEWVTKMGQNGDHLDNSDSLDHSANGENNGTEKAPNSTQKMIQKLTEQPLNGDEIRVIKGLYSAGEASGGLHGRNRLGGNSLLECVVMGKKAAQSIIDTFGGLRH